MQKLFIGITVAIGLLLTYLITVKLMWRNLSGVHGSTIWIFVFAFIFCLSVTAILKAIGKKAGPF